MLEIARPTRKSCCWIQKQSDDCSIYLVSRRRTRCTGIVRPSRNVLSLSCFPFKREIHFLLWLEATVDTKFENNLGLIVRQTTKSWIRVSEGPVLPIDSVDPFGIGSTTVAFNPQDNLYYMLYTSFLSGSLGVNTGIQ